MIKISTLVAIVIVLSSCTWVRISDQGALVEVATPTEVTACSRLSTTTVSLLDRVWHFNRSSQKVERELETLARNRVVELGADTIVPDGPVVEGERRYAAYRCNNL